MGGDVDIKLDEKNATKMKVGAAFVTLFPGDEDDKGKPGSYKFFLTVINDGVKDASCDKKLPTDKPVGGTNWALTFDTLNANKWEVGSKEPMPLSPSFYYTEGGSSHALSPWSDPMMDKNEVRVSSFSEKSVTFDLDLEAHSSDGNGHIKGKVTAKVCKIEK